MISIFFSWVERLAEEQPLLPTAVPRPRRFDLGRTLRHRSKLIAETLRHEATIITNAWRIIATSRPRGPDGRRTKFLGLAVVAGFSLSEIIFQTAVLPWITGFGDQVALILAFFIPYILVKCVEAAWVFVGVEIDTYIHMTSYKKRVEPEEQLGLQERDAIRKNSMFTYIGVWLRLVIILYSYVQVACQVLPLYLGIILGPTSFILNIVIKYASGQTKAVEDNWAHEVERNREL